jgi:hypothetical protein
MAKAGKNHPKSGQSGARQARLAAALRENLRRRKAQARGRDGAKAAPERSKAAATAKDERGG